jgi:hypothetical protein
MERGAKTLSRIGAQEIADKGTDIDLGKEIAYQAARNAGAFNATRSPAAIEAAILRT